MNNHIKQAHPSQVQGLLGGSISLVVEKVLNSSNDTKNQLRVLSNKSFINKYCPFKVGDEIHWQEGWVRYQTVINVVKQSGASFAEVQDGQVAYKADGYDAVLDLKEHIRLMSSDNPLEGLCVEHEEFQPASEMPHEFIRIKHRVTAVEVKKLAYTSIGEWKKIGYSNDVHTIELYEKYWNKLNPETPYDPDLYCWFVSIEKI